MGSSLPDGDSEPAGETYDAEEAVEAVEAVRQVSPSPIGYEGFTKYVVEAEQGADLRGQLAAAVVSGGWSLLKLESVTMTLEEIFLRLTTSEEEPPR